MRIVYLVIYLVFLTREYFVSLSLSRPHTHTHICFLPFFPARTWCGESLHIYSRTSQRLADRINQIFPHPHIIGKEKKRSGYMHTIQRTHDRSVWSGPARPGAVWSGSSYLTYLLPFLGLRWIFYLLSSARLGSDPIISDRIGSA